MFFFFFKQKTAYEMRISDWSSDVCSSDLDLFSGGLVQSAEVDARSLLRAAVALGGGGGDGVAIEADGAAGVIVRRNREGDAVGRDVRIEDRDDRDAQRVGFLDRQFFLVDRKSVV